MYVISSYVHPNGLWLVVTKGMWCCVVDTLHIAQCAKREWTHDTMYSDVYCFYSNSVDNGEVFSILPTHVSNHLFSLWAKHVMIKILIILHRMSKYTFQMLNR